MNFSSLCTSCGACCRRVRNIRPDWPTRPDGACVHLNPDNSCAIYETRPKICRVDASRPSTVTEAEWNALNAKACNEMQLEDGLPVEFKVVVP